MHVPLLASTDKQASLVMKEEKESEPKNKRTNGGRLATLLVTAACVGSLALLHASFCLHRASSTASGASQVSSLIGTHPIHGLEKKFHPPFKPKKLHHGTVEYHSIRLDDHDNDSSDPPVPPKMMYQRVFTVPCDYGMLVFNIGPASTNLPYAFDIYDDAYAYLNNDHLCLLFPSWKGYQNSTQPFWNPDDPTLVQVPLGHQMHAISTKINVQPHAKPVTDDIKARGGDYVIIAKRDFYTPRYYQELKALINSWTVDDFAAFGNVEQALQEWVATKEHEREEEEAKSFNFVRKRLNGHE